MRQSRLFSKTRKLAPSDEISKNAQLLIRAGFVHKEMAGVYSMLPLGHRVMAKIRLIVDEEMEALGSEELLMSTLQNKEVWEKTGRWDDETVDVWFKSALKNGTEVGFGWSHEEPITEMMRSFISSYTDVPRYVHQFQNKLRNEVRAKSGIMRCREFVMKDMYSYCRDEEEHVRFYKNATDAYLRVFERVGLGDTTYVTSASGGVFTDKFSHEFQTVCKAGEDTIYVHKEKKLAINEEVFTPATLATLGEVATSFEAVTAAEVGNIFTFGTEKCEQMGLHFMDTDGTKKAVFLGSYGIGITRLMGVIVETFADAKGMVWPRSVAPFAVHVVRLGDHAQVSAAADVLYQSLTEQGAEVLYDDRDLRAGEKFADSDLIGIPTRVVISEKTVEAGMYEVVDRVSGQKQMLSREELYAII